MNLSNVDENLQIIRDNYPRGPFHAAIFDFDGTLSLIRRNWQEIMIPMMVDELAKTGTTETHEELKGQVENFVMQLNGRQTIYQMIQLTKEIEQRGGQPLEPIDYKHQYHDLLWEKVSLRIAAIQSGQVDIDDMTVPGSRELLQHIKNIGLQMYLASGTDLKYVKQEVSLLEFDTYFGENIYGALDDYKNFSKAMIIDKIIRDTGVAGTQIIGFGDGFVEIEEVKRVGGLAIGVASDENNCQGINPWKRERLIRAGADIIVADYRELQTLLSLINLASPSI